MAQDISPEGLESIKRSYFNVLDLFLSEKKVDSAHVRCLLKWGVQLGINLSDLHKLGKGLAPSQFTSPSDRVEKLESIYHLVYMIYMDQVVEDVELELASIYAEKLGFKKGMVGDLFKSIATAMYDNASTTDVRREVIDFLKINDA